MVIISCLASGTLLPKIFLTIFAKLHLLTLYSFSGPGEKKKTFSNRSLKWDSGTLHTTIAGGESGITAIWRLGFSCLYLSYVIINFPLAWLIFKDNRRNSNLMLLSVSTIMVFLEDFVHHTRVSSFLGFLGEWFYIYNVRKWENEECEFMLNLLPYFRKKSKVIL